MEPILNEIEIRILGSLIEKEMTTPDYYPLTLNALTNACNQKSNRAPVMVLDETDVVRALESLRHKGLAMQAHGEGSRVPKYRHSLAEKLHLEPEELAILGELFLRGPQTVGELRGRADRMHPFANLGQVEAVLQGLMEERQPPLVVRLPRQPGRKENRYSHLLGGEPRGADEAQTPPPESATLKVRAENERIEALEKKVVTLQEEVAELRQMLENFKAQFE